MNTKYFEVSILQGKDKIAHPDVTKPQTALKPDANGNKGRFYHVSVVAPLTLLANGFNIDNQVKHIGFTIFESGNRSEVFKRIEEALSDPSNFDKITLSAGDAAKIHRTVYGIAGDLRIEATVTHTFTGANGKPVESHSVQEFIFQCEEDSGAAELIMAGAHRRAARTAVITADEKTATTTVV